MEQEERSSSIYRIARTIKRSEQSLYNALRSIYEDAGFVAEIQGLRPNLPLVANLRCGLWYARKFDETCYFKSTDGHTGNWAFNPNRLNMHVAMLAAQSGGCIIVDATRKGKRFPDSFSKTVPIWACVVNRALALENRAKQEGGDWDWDCSLHLPNWVSATEKSCIEDRIESWVGVLIATGTDLKCLASVLRKPLRPLWISQTSLIWLNEVPELSSLDFTPIILVSASRPLAAPQRMSDSELSWTYIPGAADDEESWARGLTPAVFWSHAFEIINTGPEQCNRKVAEIVEKERVHKSLLSGTSGVPRPEKIPSTIERLANCFGEFCWIGNTGLAVASSQNVATQQHSLQNVTDICIIDCTGTLNWDFETSKDRLLSLHIKSSKLDRHSLQQHLAIVIPFSIKKLEHEGMKVVVCCGDGEDISVSTCLAIMLYKNYKHHEGGQISKWDIRSCVAYLCSFVPKARPSRGHLKQVFNYLLSNFNKI